MNRIPLLMIFAGVILMGAAVSCWGQEHHHPFHQDFYRTWTGPNGLSCCDARVVKDGREVGDCEPTGAELRRDKEGVPHWWAKAPASEGGQFVEIPDDKIIRQKNPTQGGTDAHLCMSHGVIRCFVPPFGGG